MAENDIYNNPDKVYSDYAGNRGQTFGPPPLPGSVAITTINGLTGPTITFGGGTSGFSFAPAGVSMTLVSPLTTKGDLLAFSTLGARLPVGANDSRLAADSTQATGLIWIAASTGWTAWSGSTDRGSHATYPSTTAAVAYDQTQIQGLMDKMKQLSEGYKAVLDDSLTQKAFKA